MMVKIGALNDRYLIIHADDFGMCHSTNKAILHLLDHGHISSTALMVNCPWALEAAAAAAGNAAYDVGIHLTLTSEWQTYKWGPVGRSGFVSTLVDEYGYFYPETRQLAEADPEQVREEIIAQIEAALKMGVEPTHLDNHMGTLRYFMDVFMDVADMYRLPIRFRENPHSAFSNGEEAHFAKLAKEKGILYPDEIIGLPFCLKEGDTYEDSKKNVLKILQGLQPGVTELLFHPSLDTDELKAITDTWQARRYEFDLFQDSEIQETIQKEGIKVIGWRTLRDIQRQKT